MFRPKKSHAGLIILLVILSFVAPVSTRAQSVSPEMQHASELLLGQHWAEAAAAYEVLLKNEPTNPRAWYQLGLARYQLGQFPAAVTAFEKNVALNPNPFGMFNLAASAARANDKEKAFTWLAKVFVPENKQAPFFDINDTDFDSMHGDPRFAPLALAADKLKNPCMHSEQSRQFDFWVGEWDVFDPTGRKAGGSVIQRFAGGCGILENWSGTGGGDGKSINFYDPQTQKWNQYWIGADGQPTRYSGSYREGALRYDGEPQTQNGKRTLSRLTFFNLDANTVRQLAEQSTDEGKTWIVTYDFKYVRRGSTVAPTAKP